jgi:hypothetical protein
VLTRVVVYSQWANVDPLVLNVTDRPETDPFEVRNIDGLGPVKADINTVDRGSIPGTGFVGSNVGERNLVFTLGVTPDWENLTVSEARRLLDKYFMPEQSVALTFETNEYAPVEISGWVESNEANLFTKDSEHQISIICPELYFKAIDPIVIEGNTTDGPVDITYEGNVETGINVVITHTGSKPDYVKFKVMEPEETYIQIAEVSDISGVVEIEISTVPGNKYVRNNEEDEGHVSLLGTTEMTNWLVLSPDTVSADIESNNGVQDWTITYRPLFGSL